MPMRNIRKDLRSFESFFVPISATFRSVATPVIVSMPNLTHCCSHRYFVSICLRRPTPWRWANALQLLESVTTSTSVSFLTRNVHNLPMWMPSAPPPTAARYSLSQELKAMLFWERDRLVTARPFRKIIADENWMPPSGWAIRLVTCPIRIRETPPRVQRSCGLRHSRMLNCARMGMVPILYPSFGIPSLPNIYSNKFQRETWKTTAATHYCNTTKLKSQKNRTEKCTYDNPYLYIKYNIRTRAKHGKQNECRRTRESNATPFFICGERCFEIRCNNGRVRHPFPRVGKKTWRWPQF